MSGAVRIEPDIESDPLARQVSRPTAVVQQITIAMQSDVVGTVLTAEGQRWGDITSELRQLVALLAPATVAEEAELLVSSQHMHDPYVMAFMDRLDRAGVQFQTISSTLSDIKSLYQNAGKAFAGSVDSTQRQQEVIRIIGAAHARGASDVHFVVGHEITYIKFREDGLLREYGQIQSAVGNELCSSLFNSMCDVKSEGYYQPDLKQDARMARTFLDQLGLSGARVANGMTYTVTEAGLPQDACVTLATKIGRGQKVTTSINGGTDVSGEVSSATATSGCTTDSNTVAWTAY